MTEKQHGRTFWDFLSDTKALFRSFLVVAILVVIHLLIGLVWGVNFKVSIKDWSYGFSKPVSSKGNEMNLPEIDTLITGKYLPALLEITSKAYSSEQSAQNEAMQPAYIKASAKLIGLLQLKESIQKGIVSSDSLKTMIDEIEKD